jgi:hypothetical protein
MIKYTPANQLTLEGFSTPFDNSLSPDNRWVKLAKVIPWDALAKVYISELNSYSGRESIDARMVIGALIVKHRLGLDDRGTVTMISENIYLQYFCGLTSFQVAPPFHPTVFVDIRKRMGAVSFDKWNEKIIEKADTLKPKKKRSISKDDSEDDDTKINKDKPSAGKKKSSPNKGTLKIDATVADQKIVYPTDAGLLNTARKESERLIDLLDKQSTYQKKPRTYRRIARTEYLNFSKNRRKSKKVIRKFIRKQLGYLKRNLTHIEKLLDNIEQKKRQEKLDHLYFKSNPKPCKFPLSWRNQKIYWVIQLLYEQQKYMYDNKIHSVSNRIVNIYQPYVRPISRGKDKASTEFGSKISASEVEGFSRVEHISWDNFNESRDLELQVESFKITYKHYPELVLADQIYLTRKNRKYLNDRGIRIVGKPLGRPKMKKLDAYQRRMIKKQRNQRNLIEGKFGQAKNAYGLSDIKAKRRDTSESWIGAIFFVMNLISLMKIADKYAIFCAYFKNTYNTVIANLFDLSENDLWRTFQGKTKRQIQNNVVFYA